MQSEQMRQRKRERKRLEREEMRRRRQPLLPVGMAVSVEWLREVELDDEAQMCARGDVLLSGRTAALFRAAMQKARKEAGRQLSPGECLARIAKHFVDTWGPILRADATQELVRRTLPEPVPSPSPWTADSWRWKEGARG